MARKPGLPHIYKGRDSSGLMRWHVKANSSPWTWYIDACSWAFRENHKLNVEFMGMQWIEGEVNLRTGRIENARFTKPGYING